jgi:hypothetical protein
VTSTIRRTWSLVVGSRASSSRARSSAFAVAVPPTGMSFGFIWRKNCATAAPSLVSGKLIGSPAKATAAKRAPGRLWMRCAVSALARAIRLGTTSRAYMLFE